MPQAKLPSFVDHFFCWVVNLITFYMETNNMLVMLHWTVLLTNRDIDVSSGNQPTMIILCLLKYIWKSLSITTPSLKISLCRLFAIFWSWDVQGIWTVDWPLGAANKPNFSGFLLFTTAVFIQPSQKEPNKTPENNLLCASAIPKNHSCWVAVLSNHSKRLETKDPFFPRNPGRRTTSSNCSIRLSTDKDVTVTWFLAWMWTKTKLYIWITNGNLPHCFFLYVKEWGFLKLDFFPELLQCEQRDFNANKWTVWFSFWVRRMNLTYRPNISWNDVLHTQDCLKFEKWENGSANIFGDLQEADKSHTKIRMLHDP